MSLFNFGEYKLHSGDKSNFLIDCNFLTVLDLDALARRIAQKISFKEVSGVPHGGIAFANALRAYVNPWSDTTLVVDDVYTTGASIQEHMHKLLDEDSNRNLKAIVIFDRSVIGCLYPVQALLKVNMI